jgi:hypothetical protein
MDGNKRVRSIVSAVALAAALLAVAGVMRSQDDFEIRAQNANCAAMTAEYREARAREVQAAARAERSELTEQVVRRLGAVRLSLAAPQTEALRGTIDRRLFEAMRQAGANPAPGTTDWEFIRRATLDLTGRIPTAERVLQFAADGRPDKRALLVDELLASPAWADKWTMYFGDLFRNTSRTAQVVRYDDGRNALYQYIRQALGENRPYNRLATELITAQGANSYQDGALNFPVGGFVTGGPAQDVFDSQTAQVFEVFLGVSHLNCVLCHNGKYHLDELSLWGKGFKREQAWQLASHFSRTNLARTRVNSGSATPYYWSVQDTRRVDYTLNTTFGNRPARCAGDEKPAANQPCAAVATVRPQYLDGASPAAGENYREFLAAKITGDVQFSRAIVNYVWAEFFGRGLVHPANQFDLARQDPDNPPPAPWKLQASNPRLLNELAAEFQQNGFDLKWLMRQIAVSDAYQLSSRYEAEWRAAWEPLFARKLVRRLWAEEIHDSIAQASNMIPSYTVRGLGPVRWAMQLPEPRGLPDGAAGAVSQFLDAFFRGNREDADRRGDGSIPQALNLMNDNFVMARIRSSARAGINGAEPSLLAANLTKGDAALVEGLFLSVLSRYPSPAELSAATSSLQGTSGTLRRQRAENLLWALFNKVDFLYNY